MARIRDGCYEYLVGDTDLLGETGLKPVPPGELATLGNRLSRTDIDVLRDLLVDDYGRYEAANAPAPAIWAAVLDLAETGRLTVRTHAWDGGGLCEPVEGGAEPEPLESLAAEEDSDAEASDAVEPPDMVEAQDEVEPPDQAEVDFEIEAPEMVEVDFEVG